MRYNSQRPAANTKQPPSLVCYDLNIDERLRTSGCSSQQKQNDHAFFAIGVIGFFFLRFINNFHYKCGSFLLYWMLRNRVYFLYILYLYFSRISLTLLYCIHYSNILCVVWIVPKVQFATKGNILCLLVLPWLLLYFCLLSSSCRILALIKFSMGLHRMRNKLFINNLK